MVKQRVRVQVDSFNKGRGVVELYTHSIKMSMTTVAADASQSIFEFLHSELVSYLQQRPPGSDKVGYVGR